MNSWGAETYLILQMELKKFQKPARLLSDIISRPAQILVILVYLAPVTIYPWNSS